MAIVGVWWPFVLRSPCPHFGEPPYSTQTSHSLGLYGLEGASKINQGTKSNTHQPFKLHLFKAERLASLLPYQNLNESWRNHAKKNSTSTNSVVTFGSPTHRSMRPITPQGAGLLGPCRTPGPLAFGAAGHR